MNDLRERCSQVYNSPFYHVEVSEEIPPPMMIMGPATYVEYLKQCFESGTELEPSPQVGAFFYFVSMD